MMRYHVQHSVQPVWLLLILFNPNIFFFTKSQWCIHGRFCDIWGATVSIYDTCLFFFFLFSCLPARFCSSVSFDHHLPGHSVASWSVHVFISGRGGRRGNWVNFNRDYCCQAKPFNKYVECNLLYPLIDFSPFLVEFLISCRFLLDQFLRDRSCFHSHFIPKFRLWASVLGELSMRF